MTPRSTASRRSNSWRIRSVAALMLVAAGALAPAAEKPKINRGGIHLGGPDVTEKSMEGRVVLLALWGIPCEPCAVTMPLLERLHRTLGSQGLLDIGAHIQDGTAEDVALAAARLGVTFPIVGNTWIEGLERMSQMPLTLLFDHTGTCVFQGSALDVGPVATAAVNAAPPLVLDGRRLEKLEAWGREIVEQAPEARAADPARARDALQPCAAAFKGDPIGTDAAKAAGR